MIGLTLLEETSKLQSLIEAINWLRIEARTWNKPRPDDQTVYENEDDAFSEALNPSTLTVRSDLPVRHACCIAPARRAGQITRAQKGIQQSSQRETW
jgi:hypothetical protein